MRKERTDSGNGSLGSNFWRLWTATAISNLGDGVRMAALPLLAATMTRDPLLVAGTVVAAQLPWLLFALVSGALVDRIDRRKIILFANAFRAVVMGLLALAISAGVENLPLVYIVMFLLGNAETLFDSGSAAMIPSVVAEENLEKANGRLEGVIVLTQTFVGPPVGAALFVLVVSLPLYVDAVSFALAAGLVWTIRGTSQEPRQEEAPLSELIAEVKHGIRWVWHQPAIRTLSLIAALANFVMYATLSTRVLFASGILGLGAKGFGVLLAAEGAGAIVGATTRGESGRGSDAGRRWSRLWRSWPRPTSFSASRRTRSWRGSHSPWEGCLWGYGMWSSSRSCNQ